MDIADLAARDDEVARALPQLPPRQRTVLVLRHWQDLSEAEIASQLGIAPGSVKSAASRGMARLQVLLDGVHGRSDWRAAAS